MGAWGTDPWDNDTAADWFGDLWDAVPIVGPVHAGLTSEESDEVVAALWLTVQLCRVYVWPVARMDETLDLAIGAAAAILAGEDPDGHLERWEDDPDVRAQIAGFHAELLSRRSDPAE